MQTPNSQPASPSACTRRAAYGAPDAPVMPRKILTALLLLALGRLEEDREQLQVRVTEVGKRRHRRARVHAARALEVVDLELLALALRPLGREVARPEGRRAAADVRVAGLAARGRQELRP